MCYYIRIASYARIASWLLRIPELKLCNTKPDVHIRVGQYTDILVLIGIIVITVWYRRNTFATGIKKYQATQYKIYGLPSKNYYLTFELFTRGMIKNGWNWWISLVASWQCGNILA